MPQKSSLINLHQGFAPDQRIPACHSAGGGERKSSFEQRGREGQPLQHRLPKQNYPLPAHKALVSEKKVSFFGTISKCPFQV